MKNALSQVEGRFLIGIGTGAKGALLKRLCENYIGESDLGG